MKGHLMDNLMTNNDILMDVYLQTRKLEVGKDKLFIETLMKHMPDGKQLGLDAFEKFDLYKKLSADLNSIEPVKNKHNDSTGVKIKPQ